MIAEVPYMIAPQRDNGVVGQTQAVDSLELSMVAKHAYLLAQAFNSFYHRYPVVQEADADARALRCAGCTLAT